MRKQYQTFGDFFAFYLSEHSDIRNRRMHFLGSSLVLATLIAAIITQHWILLLAAPLAGYGPAWFGHFFFEKNRPATFQYPVYSLIGDWVMYWQMLTGKLPL